MNITKALSDETRIRALLALRGGELCVCQITEMLGLAPSTISKHLSVLAQAGLAESRKDGRWIYYKLPGRAASAEAREALRWVGKSLEGTPRAAADRNLLKKILREDPAEICRRQCEK